MTGAFVLIVAMQSYGFTAGPFATYAECEVSRGVVVRALADTKWPFVAFCIPEDKR